MNARDESARRPGTLVAAGILLVATLAVYGNALRNDFIIDDRVVILGDRRIQQFDVRQIFTGEYWPGATGNRLYRPLTSLTLAANWAASHEPWTFRLVNVLLHALAGFGVFLVLRDLAPSAHAARRAHQDRPGEVADAARWPNYAAALAAGLLFVVHPIHTTPLNQVVDRADIGAAAGVLLATWLYLRDARPTPASPTLAASGGGWARPLLAAAVTAIALLFKESAVAIIGVIAVLDAALFIAARPRRPTASADKACRELALTSRGWWPRRAVRCYVPLLAIILAYVAARTAVLGSVGRPAAEISALDNIIAHPEYNLQDHDSRFLARWGTPVAVFGKAVRLLLWPAPLSFDYSYAAIDNVRRWGEPRLWGGIATLAACVIGLWWSWRRTRITFVALGFGLVTYSLVSNTVFLVGSTFAERYLYLPSAGFCMLVAWLSVAGLTHSMGEAAPARPLRGRLLAIAAGAALVLLACGSATIVRNRDFRDNATLIAADLQTQPRSARLWRGRAADAVRAGRYDEALEFVAQAQAIYPADPDAWLTAAQAHWGRRDAGPALQCIQECGRAGGAAGAELALLASEVLVSMGDHERAIAVLRRLATQWPGNATATVYNNLAYLLLTAEPAELRDPAQALSFAHQAVALQPDASDVLETYVLALVVLERHDEARRVLDDALPRIPPTDPHRPRLVQQRAAL